MLLDNGRTRALADEVGRQALRCIRCSACLNVVPGLRAGRRPRLRLGLPRPDRRHPQPAAQGRRARPAGRLAALRLHPVRGVRRRLPGRHRHPGDPGAPAHEGGRRPPRRHGAQGRGGRDAGRRVGDGRCRPDGTGRTARRCRWSTPSRPGDAGWPPGAVLAALAGLALDPDPRPAPAAHGVVPGVVAPGRARRGAVDERPRRRARRGARGPGAGARARRRAGDIRRCRAGAGGHGGGSPRPRRDARPLRRAGRRLPRHRDPLRGSRSRRDRRAPRSTAPPRWSCRPGSASRCPARSSTTA